MRAIKIGALAVAALVFIGCETPLTTKPDQQENPQPEVKELLESQCITDQEIGENAQKEPTGCLWPPLPEPSCSVYAITFIWGHLTHPRMPPFPVLDWSGGLRVSDSGSSVKILRTIDFEDGEDRLLSVVEPAAAAWESKTAGDFDGLCLIVRVPASSTAAPAPELTFKTALFSITLPFSQLERLLAYYPVSDTDGVGLFARRLDGHAWTGGFIKGEWVIEANDGSRGSITGMWYNLFGLPVGTMAGSFSTLSDGGRHFEGWLSGVQLTVVLAGFKGTWSYDDPRLCATCGHGYGWFKGTYQYLSSKQTGILLGVFGDMSKVALRLPLRGIWRADSPVSTSAPPEAGP